MRHGWEILKALGPWGLLIVSTVESFAACAGAMGVSRWRFLGVLAVGRILRYSGLAYLGVKLGTVENSKAWVKAHTWHMVFIAAAIFLFFYLLLKFLDREVVEQ
jgi:membrane protein DedA with SNARE-associated domain